MTFNNRIQTEAELIRADQDRALKELTSRKKFKAFFEDTIIEGHSQYHLMGHLSNPSPASQPRQVYEMLLLGGKELVLQLYMFEAAAFDTILDEGQFVRPALYSRFTYGETFLLMMSHDSQNMKSGMWPDKIRGSIRLEDIANGNIHHNSYNPDVSLDGQSPIYVHQKGLLEFLTGYRARYGEDFWDKVRQNPSFANIDFILGKEEGKEAVERTLPGFLKLLCQTKHPDFAYNQCKAFMFTTHLLEEEATRRFLEDQTNEYKTKLGGKLENIEIPDMLLISNEGDAILMTDYERHNGSATINYILMERGKLTRQQTTLNMNTGAVLMGAEKHGPTLFDFAKQYEIFVKEYRTALQSLK